MIYTYLLTRQLLFPRTTYTLSECNYIRLIVFIIVVNFGVATLRNLSNVISTIFNIIIISRKLSA